MLADVKPRARIAIESVLENILTILSAEYGAGIKK
jgi:hypothetical protein